MTSLKLIVAASLAFGAAACTAVEPLRDAVLPGTKPASLRFTALAETGAPVLQIGFVRAGGSGVMLREASRNGVESWISPDGVGLATRDGFIAGTRGFGVGLLAVDDAQSRALILARREGDTLRFHSYLDGDDGAGHRTFACRITDRGPRELTISGRRSAVTLMAEDCTNANRSFANLYWVGASPPRLVQSRQWTGDHLGDLSLRPLPETQHGRPPR